MTSSHALVDSPSFSVRFRRFAPIIGMSLAWVTLPLMAKAATTSHPVGLHLLQAQLPAGVSVRLINCERLVRADYAATLAHRKQAVEILSAALLVGEWDEKRHAWEKFSCACVVRLFLASVNAAPEKATALLETAEAFYPECADDLAAGWRGYRAGNGQNNQSGAGSGADPDGGFGAGAGQGAGFPGSPGFSGSPASGGVALPTPVPDAVTPAVNG